MSSLLPTHYPPPSTPSHRSFALLPRSRRATFLTFFFGAVTLYIIYAASADSHWSYRLRGRPPAISSNERLLWKTRSEAVKTSFLHAWDSYERYAWGSDEVRPLTGGLVQNFNGWGVSIVDALDTLLIMDLRPQFTRAMDHVSSLNFTQAPHEVAPFFETIIRYLGGLLSAYALIVDNGATSSLRWQPTPSPPGPMPAAWAQAERTRIANILLTRADHLGRALLPAFNTSSGLPVWGVNAQSGVQRETWTSLLAEIHSCQMEYKYLAHLTGRREYFDAVNNVTTVLEALQKKQLADSNSTLGGMLPTHYIVSTGEPSDQYISVGSLADSAYEYFLKGYLLSGRSEHRLLEMYLHSTKTALHNMTFISPQRQLVYITDVTGGYPAHRMEHLSCFYPGLLALGVELLSWEGTDKTKTKTNASGPTVKVELPTDVRTRHLWAATGIAETCWLMYGDNPSGLGSEEVAFDARIINNTNGVGGFSEQYTRWWDVMDDWLSREVKVGPVPGVQGASRKKIVTNGGRNHWEIYDGMPAGNEKMSTSHEAEKLPLDDPSVPETDPQQQRTHLRDYAVRDNRWLMRPETIESLYLMYRVTKDPIWRERCYGIFQGMESHSRVTIGYASVNGVDFEIDPSSGRPRGMKVPNDTTPFQHTAKWERWDDSMPSYALAETFKYLYLCLLDPEDSAALLPSDKWIFNTEAHPLPVFNWTQHEKDNWNIR